MMIRLQRFNTYLLVAVAAAAVAVCGCQSTVKSKPKKLLSTLRLHVEASLDGTKASESVPIYREKPVWVNVRADAVPHRSECVLLPV